jgi:hypothetical protein
MPRLGWCMQKQWASTHRWVQGAGCRVQGAGCRVQGAGCRVQGAGCRAQGMCYGRSLWCMCQQCTKVGKASSSTKVGKAIAHAVPPPPHHTPHPPPHPPPTHPTPQARRVQLRQRPALAYDVLSIDIGITPAQSAVPGAAEHTTPVKPIDRWLARACCCSLLLQPGTAA